MSLVGLFAPAILVGFAGLLVAIGHRTALGRVLPLPGLPRVGPSVVWVILAGPVLLFSPLLFAPCTTTDAWQYHLAVPEHMLRLHRYAAEGTNVGFHAELVCEVQNVFAVLVRREELAAWIALAPYLAAVGLVGGWLSRLVSPLAGGIAVGLLLSINQVIYTAAVGKNDTACAGVCLMALVAKAERRQTTATILWGIAASTKINGLLLASFVFAWEAISADWRRNGVWLVRWGMAALPVLPMWGRDWLVLGDPHWPLLYRWFPGALWDRESQGAMVHAQARSQSAIASLAELGRNFQNNLPTTLLWAPLLALGWGRLQLPIRRLGVIAGAFAIGYTLTVWYEHDRLLLPVQAGMCFLIAGSIAQTVQGSTWVAGLLVGLLTCVSAWLPLATIMSHRWDRQSLKMVAGSLTREQYFSARWSTAWDARREVATLPGLRTILLVNDHSPYRWPARTRTQIFPDRSPTWELTRDALTPERIAIRLRQWNVSHLAYNGGSELYVTPDGVTQPFFAWTPRQLRLLDGWLRGHGHLVVTPKKLDYANGAYWVWRVDRPEGSFETGLPDLPGTKEMIWRIVEPSTVRGDHRESLRRAAVLLAAFPTVAIFHQLCGYFLVELTEWESAYRELSAAIRMGYLGDATYLMAAGAAVNCGRPDLAEPLARQSLDLYPDYRLRSVEILSVARALQARTRSARGRMAAQREIQVARSAVSLNPPGAPIVRLCLGTILQRAGSRIEAGEVLRDLLGHLSLGDPLRTPCLAELKLCRIRPTEDSQTDIGK